MRKRGPRPRPEARLHRRSVLALRTADWARLEAAADRQGLPLAEYVRGLVLERLAPATAEDRADVDVIREALTEPGEVPYGRCGAPWVSLDPDQIKWLEQQAKLRRCSVSQVIRTAITEHQEKISQ